MVSGIYKLMCVDNDKAYIGKTEGKIEARVNQHLDGKTPGCRAIHSAIKKYGKENFRWEILHENVIPELLVVFEKQEVAKHKTMSPHGYNLTEGGEDGAQSEETIHKRTETLRANPPMKGKKHTPEACRKMSKSRTGSRRSPETRRRMSESAMGHSVSEETKRKIGDANRGRKWSDEARQAQSERNSGEGNPMFGRKRLRGEKAANANPYMKPAREFFYSMPHDMPLKEKRERLYVEFPDVNHNLIQRWILQWIRSPYLPSGAINPLFDDSDSKTLISKSRTHLDKEPAREFFFSLPSDMDIKEKRQSLYTEFPNVKRETIGAWVREWTNYKPYKKGSRHSAEYHQAHEMFLSLPSEMSVVEKRKHIQKNIDAPNGTISRWVKQWSKTTGRQPTHPDYERVRKLFLSLSPDIRLNERCLLVCESFPNINRNTLTKWIKQWTGETMPTGVPSHPERSAIHQYFLSLPPDMSISEKRKLILEKFDDAAHRSLVNRWTRQWHIELTGSPPPVEKWYREPCNHWKKGKPAHNRRPEYDDAQKFFLSLSPMMPSKEKSKQLFLKYPHIPTGTIYQWVSRWQSD